MRLCLFIAIATFAAPVAAELDYVTDRTLCGLAPIDRSERGMTFTGKNFYEIEYFCELADPMPPLDGSDTTHMSIGYCEAPGDVFPTVFVLRSFRSEPNVLYVYESDNSDGTVFFNCQP